MTLTVRVARVASRKRLPLGAILEKLKTRQPFAILDAGLMPVRNPASATFAAKELLKVVGQQAASLSIDFASPRPHAPASAG